MVCFIYLTCIRVLLTVLMARNGVRQGYVLVLFLFVVFIPDLHIMSHSQGRP